LIDRKQSTVARARKVTARTRKVAEDQDRREERKSGRGEGAGREDTK
jgi:hypothetical protein